MDQKVNNIHENELVILSPNGGVLRVVFSLPRDQKMLFQCILIALLALNEGYEVIGKDLRKTLRTLQSDGVRDFILQALPPLTSPGIPYNVNVVCERNGLEPILNIFGSEFYLAINEWIRLMQPIYHDYKCLDCRAFPPSLRNLYDKAVEDMIQHFQAFIRDFLLDPPLKYGISKQNPGYDYIKPGSM